jgi:hypothetical protein
LFRTLSLTSLELPLSLPEEELSLPEELLPLLLSPSLLLSVSLLPNDESEESDSSLLLPMLLTLGADVSIFLRWCPNPTNSCESSALNSVEIIDSTTLLAGVLGALVGGMSLSDLSGVEVVVGGGGIAVVEADGVFSACGGGLLSLSPCVVYDNHEYRTSSLGCGGCFWDAAEVVLGGVSSLGRKALPYDTSSSSTLSGGSTSCVSCCCGVEGSSG